MIKIVITFILISIPHYLFAQTYASQDKDPQVTNIQVIKQDLIEKILMEGTSSVIISLKMPGLKYKSIQNRQTEISQLQQQLLSLLTEDDIEVRYRYKTIPCFAGSITRSGLEKLIQSPQVECIEEDMLFRANMAQSVQLIGADSVHSLGYRGNGSVVGVLDTGIDSLHLDLSDAIIAQRHFLSNGYDIGYGAYDDNGHGTHVSGIVASNGIIAPRGMAPDAKIVAVKVLNTSGFGATSDINGGLDWIAANNDSFHVNAINMSLGGGVYSGNCDGSSWSTKLAIDACRAAGIIVFASSGNSGRTDGINSPACLSNCVSVGAVYDTLLGREPDAGTYGFAPCYDEPTHPLKITCFTNRSTNLDILAPGSLITSDVPGNNVGTGLGTSMASPHAAGMAALLYEIDSTLHPDTVLSIMKSTGIDVYDSTTGLTFKRINALAGIEKIHPPMVRVLSANGGDIYEIGITKTIQWMSYNLEGNVNVELSRNGGSSFEIILSDTPNDGSESWTVTGPSSSEALIRITSVSSPSVSDTSDEIFYIVQPTISVIAPNGGEDWPIGTSRTIQWTSSNLPGNITIELSRNNGSSYETLFADIPNDGWESWTVTGPVSSAALIRITSVSIASLSDSSDAVFTIIQPTISVTVPNGGESWPIETNAKIQWVSNDLTGNVKIELSRNAGSSYELLFASTHNDSAESWNVTGPISTEAMIRITSVSIPAVSDVSDDILSIVQPALSVTVPNGGENWPIGTIKTIQWTSNNLPGKVTIELSRNNGSSYETLFTGITNDGSELWNVTGPRTPTALLRIKSDSISSIIDVSDAVFSIGYSIISGKKYGDLNGNGIKEEDEIGLSGWIIQLTGPINSSTITDENGAYSYTELPPGTYTVTEETQAGWTQTSQPHSSIVLTGGEDVLNIDFGNRFNMSFPVAGGWNMISIPVISAGYQRSELFPTSISEAFSYQTSYIPNSSLSNGLGYWLRFDTSQIIQVHGLPDYQEVIGVHEGWNIVGSISDEIPVNEIMTDPGEMVAGHFLHFVQGEGYTEADTIKPGKAYWVKLNQSGLMILSSSTANNKIISASRIIIIPTSEMPPLPPHGMDITTHEIPTQYKLGQAYPNPFNPITKIEYQLPVESKVTIRVYNTMGQVIITLCDNYQPAGYKSVEWQSQNNASGIYFYKLEAISVENPSEVFTQVQKMVLMK